MEVQELKPGFSELQGVGRVSNSHQKELCPEKGCSSPHGDMVPRLHLVTVATAVAKLEVQGGRGKK